jgi:hypothetical protein
MDSNNSKTQCAFCQESLTWWNANRCAYCGNAVCKHHAHLVKRAHNSSILASVCEKCASHADLHLEAVSMQHRHLANSHQHVAVR